MPPLQGEVAAKQPEGFPVSGGRFVKRPYGVGRRRLPLMPPLQGEVAERSEVGGVSRIRRALREAPLRASLSF